MSFYGTGTGTGARGLENRFRLLFAYLNLAHIRRNHTTCTCPCILQSDDFTVLGLHQRRALISREQDSTHTEDVLDAR